MKQKCVRWTKSVRTALIAAAAIMTAMVVNPVAQSSTPSAQPKLSFADISYLGGFRLPAESSNGDSFSFGGKQLAFNPVSNSLFVGSRAGRVAEVSIPNPVNTSNPAAMPFATYLQPFQDPTEGHLSQITGEGVSLDSLMVYGNRLYGTASIYYDANGIQQVSHYSHSLQLNEPSFSGWSRVWDAGKTGFVSGFMSVVPTEWRAALGGPAATGQCCIPIVMRTSWGPSAFSFDPAQVGQAAVSASPLFYYPAEHPTLGQWDNSNPTYGATIQMGGFAIIAGTRTALYIGRNGTGPNCYGNGTNNQALDGTIGPDGAHWCYDPTSTDKGSHAYPYRYQIWAYDVADLAAVKAGQKKAWEVVPYGVWPFDFPTPEASVRIGGVGYDAANQLLYVSQVFADRDGYSNRPVIHVLRLNATPGSTASDPSTQLPTSPNPTPTVPPTTVPPVPVSSNVVSAMTMSVNNHSPQVAGTAITFSAFATSGVTSQEYKWLVDDGTGQKAVTGWSAADTYTWTPTAANPKYRVAVWARTTGNSADAAEASASTTFAVNAPAAVPIRSVRITSDKPAPQTYGTSVKLTATVDGGNAVEYKWLLHDGGSWAAVSGWTAQSTFTWTPAMANANYRVGVWVRNNTGTSTKDEPEATSSEDFPISAAPTAPVVNQPPATAPAARLTAVTMTTNKAAPQVAGTPITFQATAVGGAAQYKFLVYDGSPTWTFLTGWTNSNTLTWTPTSANPNYTMRVWVRRATSTTDEWEAETRIEFPITAVPEAGQIIRIDTLPTAPAPVVPAPALPIANVAIATNKTAPQAAGSTIVATANVVGGSSTLQYRWLIHDGASWNVVTEWTSSKTFSWTPTAANGGHFIGVWVRNAANANGEAESTSSLPFPIQ